MAKGGRNMKRSWLYGTVAGLLLFAQEELGKEPERQEIRVGFPVEKVDVPMDPHLASPTSIHYPVVQLPRSLYEPTTYSQEEIDAKLDNIYSNIVGHPKWAENIKQVLQQMAQYDIGANLIALFSKLNVKIESAPANIMEAEGDLGYYDSNKKRIVLPLEIAQDEEVFQKIKVLFEEMLHATQDAKLGGQINALAPYPSEDIVQRQITEMAARLAVTVLESQMYQGMDDNKSPTCLFYEERLSQYESMGMLPQDAERLARTDLVRLVWSCLRDTPEGCEVLPDEKEVIINWHKAYLRSAFVNRCLAMCRQHKKMTSMTSVFSVLHAEKFATAEEKAEKEMKDNPFDIPTKYGIPNLTVKSVRSDVIPSVVADMDVSLDPDYFTKMQRERVITGRNFIIVQYPDETAIRFSLKFFVSKEKGKRVVSNYKIIEAEFENGRLIHENTYDMFGVVEKRLTFDGQRRVIREGKYENGMYVSNTTFTYHGESHNKESAMTLFMGPNRISLGGSALYFDTKGVLISRQDWDRDGKYQELLKNSPGNSPSPSNSSLPPSKKYGEQSKPYGQGNKTEPSKVGSQTLGYKLTKDRIY